MRRQSKQSRVGWLSSIPVGSGTKDHQRQQATRPHTPPHPLCIPRATATKLQHEQKRRCRPARSQNLPPLQPLGVSLCRLPLLRRWSPTTPQSAASAMGAEEANGLVVVPEPRPRKGLTSWALDLLESVAVRLGHDKAKPLHWLSGNFGPVVDETPPAPDLPVRGHLPVLTMLPPPFPLPISFFLLHIIMLLPKLKQPFFFESIKQPISPRTCGTYSGTTVAICLVLVPSLKKKNSFPVMDSHSAPPRINKLKDCVFTRPTRSRFILVHTCRLLKSIQSWPKLMIPTLTLLILRERADSAFQGVFPFHFGQIFQNQTACDFREYFHTMMN